MSGRRRRMAVWAASLAVLGFGGWAGMALTDDTAPPAAWPVPAVGAPGEVHPSSAATPATTAALEPTTPEPSTPEPSTTGPAAAAPTTTVPTATTAAASSSGSTTSAGTQPLPADQRVAAYEAQVFALVNQERAAVGCPAVTADSRLAAAARAHSADMAANGYFDHTSLDGTDFATRITRAGYRWSAAAENIAMGQRDPAAVMRAWMNSDGHRRNILNCGLRQLGVGLAYDARDRPYWTQDFASPA